jgi:molybdopterin-containing oxidoreductase family membrane subunit
MFNLILHPSPKSVLFWDMIVLNGYLFLNLIIGWTTLGADRRGMPAPGWVKPLIYLSIPWAVSIHTVTAFLYSGLPGRGFWLTAVMAPRFLASAFAAGPALLILLALIVRKHTKFDAGTKAIQALAKIVAYAIIAFVFLFFCELFTVFYSQIPEHMDHFKYLYFGLDGHGAYVPFMWLSLILAAISIFILVNPKTRENEGILIVACVMVFISTWIDKGMGMISGGFVPSPLHEVHEYIPTMPELVITIGIYAIGALILTVLYKVVVSVREQEIS